MSSTNLIPRRLDQVALTSAKPERIIWTLSGIARRIGVGPDFVRDTLAKQPGTPIKEIGGRFYVFETELMEFLRARPSPS